MRGLPLQVHVGLDPLITTWSQGHVEDLVPEQLPRLLEMIRSHVPKVLKWLRGNTSEVRGRDARSHTHTYTHTYTHIHTHTHTTRNMH